MGSGTARSQHGSASNQFGVTAAPVCSLPTNAEVGMARALRRNPRWIVGLLVVLCCASMYTIWSLRTTTQYVDIHSGRIRTDVSIVGFRIDESISETPFSRIIAELPPSPQRPEWKLFWSRSFSQPISPYYRFHRAPHDLGTLARVLRSKSQDEDATGHLCGHALRLLERGDVDGLRQFVKDVAACDADVESSGIRTDGGTAGNPGRVAPGGWPAGVTAEES